MRDVIARALALSALLMCSGCVVAPAPPPPAYYYAAPPVYYAHPYPWYRPGWYR